MNWKNNQGKGISIAVIDSGIDFDEISSQRISATELNDCTDDIGHGTAVASILFKSVPDASFYFYKLFDETGTVSCGDMVQALSDISEEKHFDIVHLSCGVVIGDCIDDLYSVCKKITDSGTVIVAAFDNEGAISYPAAFDNVIGVDWSTYCVDGTDYIFVENSNINILGTGALQKLPWRSGKNKYVAGSSFAAPYISAIIAKMLEAGVSPDGILTSLKENARRRQIIDNSGYNRQRQELKIEKAIVFPYNKEVHTLSVFEDMLKFELVGIYDFPFFRNVGKKCCDVLGFGNSLNVIESYRTIPWEGDFDTVILGHLDRISSALNKDVLKEFLEKCAEYKKNVYAFDCLDPYEEVTDKIRQNKNFVFYPKAVAADIDRSFKNKLYGISTPVVDVFGTSPQQGKFSLQLAMRRKMQSLGYKVGGLGTEPTALLFGMDCVYPFGYNSVCLPDEKTILLLNQMMHEIDRKNYDIIIAGSQSQTIPYNAWDLGQIPIEQFKFLIGTNPDAVVLCINPTDELDYVKKTVGFLNSYINAKVVALSMFPKVKELDWNLNNSQGQEASVTFLSERKDFYSRMLGIPCYISGDENELDAMIDYVTDFFVE